MLNESQKKPENKRMQLSFTSLTSIIPFFLDTVNSDNRNEGSILVYFNSSLHPKDHDLNLL